MKVKSLLIVYKDEDEEIFKHLKGLIDSNDDQDGSVGVEDGTVRVFKCPEKQWLKYKAKGKEDRLADKTLFIDDMQGITVSGPVKPIYSQYGISYGPIDSLHYLVEVDENYVWEKEVYRRFQEELKQLTNNADTKTDAFASQEEAKERMKKNGKLLALSLLFPPALLLTGGMVAIDASEVSRNAKVIRSQMLYFALTKVYLEELDAFMKS